MEKSPVLIEWYDEYCENGHHSLRNLWFNEICIKITMQFFRGVKNKNNLTHEMALDIRNNPEH